MKDQRLTGQPSAGRFIKVLCSRLELTVTFVQISIGLRIVAPTRLLLCVTCFWLILGSESDDADWNQDVSNVHSSWVE